jgi:vacuolar-type H+-ATPase subunit C/Vma6
MMKIKKPNYKKPLRLGYLLENHLNKKLNKQQEVLLNVAPEKLPSEYVKVTYQPDLTKIRTLLKADAQGAIGWASLGESHQYSVTIR